MLIIILQLLASMTIIKTKRFEYQTHLIKGIYHAKKSIVLTAIHGLFKGLGIAPTISNDSVAKFVLRHSSEQTKRTKGIMSVIGLSCGLWRIAPSADLLRSQATALQNSNESRMIGLRNLRRIFQSSTPSSISSWTAPISTRMVVL